jgi:Zn-dependent M32 family carboxypeptidase
MRQSAPIPASRAAISRRSSLWRRTNVHAKGSRFSTAEIITQATGRPLDARTYERHLETRYLAA